jgi:hypothetical protein
LSETISEYLVDRLGTPLRWRKSTNAARERGEGYQSYLKELHDADEFEAEDLEGDPDI